MTGEWKWRLAIVAAVLLLASVTFFVGERTQKRKDQDDALKAKIVVGDSVTRSDSSRADTAKKKSEILTVYRSHVREKVVVKSDTVFVDRGGGPDRDTVVSPEISRLITADDSTISALKNFVAAQEVVIADQRQQIALRDERIALLEKPSSKTSRFITAAKWLTTGVVVGLAVAHR